MKIQNFFNHQLKSFKASLGLYPIAWLSAFLFSFLGIANGYNTLPHTQTLIDHILYALAVGMLAGLCVPAIFYKRLAKPIHIFAHLIALVLIGIAYGLISYESPYSGQINHLRIAVLCASLIFLAFVFVPDQDRPVHSWMSIALNAALVSMLFGLSALIGLFIITGAIDTLFLGDHYNPFRHLVPTYLSGLILFASFMLRFPQVHTDQDRHQRVQMAAHNKAIRILTDFVIAPLVLIAMAILLVWNLPFIPKQGQVNLSFAGATFSVVIMVGIALMIYIYDHIHPMALFYKKIFPLAGILLALANLILGGIQVFKVGLVESTYFSISVALFAILACHFLKDKKNHRLIPALLTLLIVFYVTPYTGFHMLPDMAQANRLERVLLRNQYFNRDPSQPMTLSERDQDQIRTSVNALMWKDKALLPDWFDTKWSDDLYFKKTFGFERDEFLAGPVNDHFYYANLDRTPIKIQGYDYALFNVDMETPPFQCPDGRDLTLTYEAWSHRLKANLDGQEVLNKDLAILLAPRLLNREFTIQESSFKPEEVAIHLETEDFILLVHPTYLSWRQDTEAVTIEDLGMPTVYIQFK